MTRIKQQYNPVFIVSFSMRMFLLSGVFCFTYLLGFSQIQKPQNYKRFDERALNFGFMLGINSADFIALPYVDAYEKYGLISLTTNSQPGGQVGIVTTLKLGTPLLRLRLIPTLSFQERAINYVFKSMDSTKPSDIYNEERVNSTNLDFPLMFQFRTLRYNNFTSYVLVGFQYSIDLQTQQDASQSLIDPFIKINRRDYQGQIGAGVEFFAPFFKFGIEVKYSHGLVNSFIQDNTKVSSPINRMNNRVLWLSFIFEG
jgi:hypothetical protein